MARLCEAYVKLLQKDEPASERFWALEKRIKKDVNRPGVIVEMKRSNMIYDMARLIKDGVITLEDLTEFSEEVQMAVKMLTGGLR